MNEKQIREFAGRIIFKLTDKWEYLRGNNEQFIEAIMPVLREHKDPLLSEALEAIRGAMRIAPLWTVPDDVYLDYPGEDEAMQMMESKFKAIIDKADKDQVSK